MAVFFVNTCKFKACGLTYGTLSELIQHIEETHLDTDPHALEQQETLQPQSLALSYVFRVFTEAANKEKRRLSSLSPVSSIRSATPTGSEFDEEDARSSDEDSDDSWTTQEEFTSEVILSMMANSARDSNADKPFACPVPGCKKRYKNINGIKYHAKHAHKKEVRVRKPYKCKCGKSYKTSTGLQSHSLIHHQGSMSSLLALKPKSTAKPRQKTMASKPKSTGSLGNLPSVTNLTMTPQSRINKPLPAALSQAVITNPNSGPIITGPISGSPATTLVTVPVTFSKLLAANGKEVNKDSLFPQQHMLNLIAPSGLVPPGTTITVPMEQFARNLALLTKNNSEHMTLLSNSNTVANMSTGKLSTAGSTIPSQHATTKETDSSSFVNRLIRNTPEIVNVPSCMLTEEVRSPFDFTESGYEDNDDEEMGDVDILDSKSQDEDEVNILSFGSQDTTETSKGIQDTQTSKSIYSFSSHDTQTTTKNNFDGLKNSESGIKLDDLCQTDVEMLELTSEKPSSGTPLGEIEISS